MEKKNDIKKREKEEKLKVKKELKVKLELIGKREEPTYRKHTHKKKSLLKAAVLGPSSGSGSLLFEYYESFINIRGSLASTEPLP